MRTWRGRSPPRSRRGHTRTPRSCGCGPAVGCTGHVPLSIRASGLVRPVVQKAPPQVWAMNVLHAALSSLCVCACVPPG